MRRFAWIGILLAAFVLLLPQSVHAEPLSLPEISLPEPIENEFGESASDVESLLAWVDASKVFRFAAKQLSATLPSATELFLSLLSVIAIAAVMGALGDSMKNRSVQMAFEYLSVLSCAALVLSSLKTLFSLLSQHLSTLSAFTVGVVPTYVGVCVASGMTTLGAVGGTGLALSASFASLVANQVLYPLMCVCFLLDFCAAVSSLSGMMAFSAVVKRFFVGLVGFVCAVLTSVFAFQTRIAAKADTLAGRTVRYVTATTLPMVGSALAEASRTLSSAFSLMGGVVGGMGLVSVLLLFLPILFQLFLLRMCFLSAGGVAEVLGLTRLGPLFSKSGALVGAMMATVALVDAVWIFEFAILLGI